MGVKECRKCGVEQSANLFRAKRRVCRLCDAAAARARREGVKQLAAPESVEICTPSKMPVTPGLYDMPEGVRILVIPDTQVRPGSPTEHIAWIGNYIDQKRPDFVVMLGDWFDFPSLSSYSSEVHKARHGYTVENDYAAGCAALALLMEQVDNPEEIEWHFAMGNHEHRRDRAIEANPSIGLEHVDPAFAFGAWGWNVHAFLDPFEIAGVHFCHYFVRSAGGTVMQTKRGQPSALQQARREMVSTVAGHKQGFDTHIQENGRSRIRAIIAGSAYSHDEDYLSHQGKRYWRGILDLRDVHDGDYELKEVSLKHLYRRYR